MNFWNIQKLKNDLTNKTINQRDLLIYYCFIGLLTALIASPEEIKWFDYYQEESYKWVQWGFENILYLLTIFLCYVANNGKNGQNFLERYISIEIIIFIRYFVFLFIPIEIVHSLFFDGGIYSDMFNLIGSISLDLILLIRTFSCIKDVVHIQSVEN